MKYPRIKKSIKTDPQSVYILQIYNYIQKGKYVQNPIIQLRSMLSFKILHCSFWCDRYWLVILSMDDAWRRLTFNSTNTATAHRYGVQRESTVHLDEIIKYNIYLATRQIYVIYFNTSNTTVIFLSINSLQNLVYFSTSIGVKI